MTSSKVSKDDLLEADTSMARHERQHAETCRDVPCDGADFCGKLDEQTGSDGAASTKKHKGRSDGRMQEMGPEPGEAIGNGTTDEAAAEKALNWEDHSNQCGGT